MQRDTEIVHAGYRKKSEPGAFLTGPQFASTYTTPGDPSQHAFSYGRFHNPTWTAWEEALADSRRRRPGGGIRLGHGRRQCGVRRRSQTRRRGRPAGRLGTTPFAGSRQAGWSRLRVQVRLAPTRGNAQVAALDGARLLCIETPSNPMLDVCDIRGLVAAAQSRGVMVAVDNTTATAYLQQPLDLGATFVMASDTKALTGHSDLILGHVATRDASLAEALRTWRTHHGAIPGPMEVWLAHRSLPTLPLRRRAAVRVR